MKTQPNGRPTKPFKKWIRTGVTFKGSLRRKTSPFGSTHTTFMIYSAKS